MASPKFKHLLLDLDGTLIYSGSILVHVDFLWRMIPYMKKRYGWKASWKALKEGGQVLKSPTPGAKSNHERLVDVFSRNLMITKEEAETSIVQSLKEVFPRLKNHFGTIKGAADFVNWARDHYTLTLATNPVWKAEFVKMRMIWGGIDPEDFKSITTSDRMHSVKPTPEYYREILSQEGFKPEDCLLVGNERKMDLPATEVGISVFLLRPAANEMTCIQEQTGNTGAAWRGNFQHLRSFLTA